MNIGIVIKETRKRNHIKQYVLAQEIGITQTYLSQIESGRKTPSFEILERVCIRFNLPIPVLLWVGLTIEDVPVHKRELFHAIRPSLDALLESVFNF